MPEYSTRPPECRASHAGARRSRTGPVEGMAISRIMSPGGHLATTVLACAAAGLLTGSATFTAGVALGGFFIDVDHAADYVLVEGQRDLRPGSFLRYYVEGRARRLILPLHSYELFGILGVLAWWFESPWLLGYLAGGSMHLLLDIAFNGRLTPRNIWAFYSIAYRARHRFAASALFGAEAVEPASQNFWKDFVRGTRLRRRPASGSTAERPVTDAAPPPAGG